MRQLAVLLAVLMLALTGCGGDDDDDNGGSSNGGGSDSADTQQTEAAPEPADDEEAVRQAVITYQTTADCEVLSDKFLDEQVVFSDATERDELCEAYAEEGQIGNVDEEDVEIGEVTVEGDTATVVQTAPGGTGPTTYELIVEDGRWRIDSAEL